MVKAYSKIQAAKTTPGVIDEVFSGAIHERIRDDDITVRRMREKLGWGREKCETHLAKKVAAGILVPVTVLNEFNQETTAWRKPVDTKC